MQLIAGNSKKAVWGQVAPNPPGPAVGTSYNDAPLYELATWQDFRNDPKPLVLHVATFLSQSETSSPKASPALRYWVGCYSQVKSLSYNPDSGLSPAGPQGLAGVQLDYGCGEARHSVIFDLKPGSYQLPPCTYAKASVFGYTDSTSAFTTGGRSVAMALCVGEVQTPTRPEVTHAELLGNGDALSVRTPAQARWADVWAEIYGTRAIGAADLPQLMARGRVSAPDDYAGLATLVRDYVNGAFTPGWGPVEFSGTDNCFYRVENLNAASVDVLAVLRFWLEL